MSVVVLVVIFDVYTTEGIMNKKEKKLFLLEQVVAATACAARAKIGAWDLRSKEELLKRLDDLKVELSYLCVTKVTSGVVSNLSKIWVVYKYITCVLLVINKTQRKNLRKFFKGKKYRLLYL